MAYSNLSQLNMLAGNNDEPLAWGSRAIGLADSLDQTEILIDALTNVGTVEMNQGRPAGARTLERSLALALAHGLEEHAARAYTNVGYTALNQRDYPLASRYLDEGTAPAPSATWTPGGCTCWCRRPGPTSSRDAGYGHSRCCRCRW